MPTAVLLASLLLLAPAKARIAVPLPPDLVAAPDSREIRRGVRIFSKSDGEYASLSIPARAQLFPEADERLVVFRDGAPVFDRGLRVSTQVTGTIRDAAGELEEGVAEDAVVSADAQFALLATTHFRRPALKSGEPRETPRRATGVTELIWIDADHPQGLWTVPLENGRWIKSIVPLAPRRGVAVSTVADPDEADADMRILGPEGMELLRIRETEGSTTQLVTTPLGAFLAVDLLYPDRLGMPNEGITVLDLTYDTRWTYTWTYGDDAEPLSWKLDDTGVLQVTTPAAVRSFDRKGKPLGLVKRK